MSLARNTLLNLGAQVLPLLIAILVFPALWRALGRDMFGMLLLIWSIIGYFSLFDLGLGRALTRMTAQVQQQVVDFSICDIVTMGLLMMVAISAGAMFLMGLLIPWGSHVLVRGDAIAPEQVARLLTLTSYAIPLTIIGLCFRATLEGLQYFHLTATVRFSYALFLLGSPYLVVLAGGKLEHIVLVLLAGIVASSTAYGVLLVRSLRGTRSCSRGSHRLIILRNLARYSGWVSVSNFIAPVLYYVDRFIIGATLGVGIMSYYVTPYELISKTLIIASAISGAFFPRLAGYSQEELSDAGPIVRTGTKLNYLLTFPIALVCCIWAQDLLYVWMGTEIAEQGSRILQILACGVVLNAAAYMPFTFLQASGRPDLAARLHLVELPIYAIALAFIVPQVGIVGAAWVWTVRALVELIAFTFMAASITGSNRTRSDLIAFVACTTILLLIAYSDHLPDATLRATLIIVVSALTFVYLWRRLLEPSERDWLLTLGMRRHPT